MKRDVPATKAKQFLDPRSYVARDGREVLYGKDWKYRVNIELFLRCGGRCEEVGTMRCIKDAAHPHHIIKRSKGRDDSLKNLMALCELHHRKRHPEFEPQFSGSRKGVEA